jgi:hypothetical protein
VANLSLYGIIVNNVNVSGSVKFTPIWTTLDESYVFTTGSAIAFWPPQRTGHKLDRSNLTVTATGIKKSHKTPFGAYGYVSKVSLFY